MEWWQIYLLTRMEDIKLVAILSSFLMGLICILIAGPITEGFTRSKDLKKPFQILLATFVVSLITAVLTPTTKDIAIIISGHWATHNEEMKALPDNVLKVLNGLLEKANTELKEK